MNLDHLLCRAKRINNGEWVVGFFDGFFIQTRDKHDHFLDAVLVDNDTIQKCTGWRDKPKPGEKEGKLVFDGMYFEWNQDIYQISWNDELLGFEFLSFDDFDKRFSWQHMIEFDRDEISLHEFFNNLRIKEDGTAEIY